MKYLFILLVAFSVIRCDKPRNNTDFVPPGSKPGWNAEQIDTAIGCDPFPGPVCNCVVPEITKRFTPEEVRQKSVPVSQAIDQIYSQCRVAVNPKPAPEVATFKPGALVTAKENANLYYGNNVVGSVTKGHRFRITKMQDPWVQLETLEGTKIEGWILLKHLELTP